MVAQTPQHHQQLYLKDRKALTLDAVKSVKDFTESQLIVDTELGTVYIEGEELKIESLSKENASILVTGNISGFYYKSQKPRRSIFSRKD
ncbi:MAG: sporulation protein YabP [Clostridia bacterium]|nr:sporulation protein YabP [Clostridia bacterium]